MWRICLNMIDRRFARSTSMFCLPFSNPFHRLLDTWYTSNRSKKCSIWRATLTGNKCNWFVLCLTFHWMIIVPFLYIALCKVAEGSMCCTYISVPLAALWGTTGISVISRKEPSREPQVRVSCKWQNFKLYCISYDIIVLLLFDIQPR